MMMKRMLNFSLMWRRGANNNNKNDNSMEATSSSSTAANGKINRRWYEEEAEENGTEWEMRPGGMLVQKRNQINLADNTSTGNMVRVRVVYGSARYEISVQCQSTFGEVKKLLAEECGLQQWEQRLIFRGRERADRDFLDMAGVKNRSKLVLIEDPCSREKRLVELRRTGKIQRALHAIAVVSAEVDRLSEQVLTIDKSIESGVKVPGVQITTMIELLMVQAVKLDSILDVDGDGDQIPTLKALQGKRVQKCVEILDVLKISNASIKPVTGTATSKWETFEPPRPVDPPWNLLD